MPASPDGSMQQTCLAAPPASVGGEVGLHGVLAVAGLVDRVDLDGLTGSLHPPGASRKPDGASRDLQGDEAVA